jgi:HEAT repeat protein
MTTKKREIAALLEKKDFSALKEIPSPEKTVALLISLSYDKQKTLSWRAIEAIGLVTAELAGTDPGRVRNIVGRLLWMIRDESGGIGWSVPEILGEIVRNNPVLCEDIAPIVASFHDEKMLTAGVLWALSRIGRINAETVRYAVPIIRSYLNADDPVTRGFAVRAAAGMGDAASLDALEKMKEDTGEVSVYENGELVRKTVARLSDEAVKKLTEVTSRERS